MARWASRALSQNSTEGVATVEVPLNQSIPSVTAFQEHLAHTGVRVQGQITQATLAIESARTAGARRWQYYCCPESSTDVPFGGTAAEYVPSADEILLWEFEGAIVPPDSEHDDFPLVDNEDDVGRDDDIVWFDEARPVARGAETWVDVPLRPPTAEGDGPRAAARAARSRPRRGRRGRGRRGRDQRQHSATLPDWSLLSAIMQPPRGDEVPWPSQRLAEPPLSAQDYFARELCAQTMRLPCAAAAA